MHALLLMAQPKIFANFSDNLILNKRNKNKNTCSETNSYCNVKSNDLMPVSFFIFIHCYF